MVAVWLRNRRPLVSLGIGWFFAGQLLTATIIPLELVYEQRMYFSSIGVLLAAGALLLGLRWKSRCRSCAASWSGRAAVVRGGHQPARARMVESAAVGDRGSQPTSRIATRGLRSRAAVIDRLELPSGQGNGRSWKYLREASAIPGSSSLPEQAMIMLADHDRQGADAEYWHSMIHKLRDQPTRQEDISALISLTNCYDAGICKFDKSWLQRAYEAALSRPHPIARLEGAYADFQRDVLHDDMQAEKYLARAVAGAPENLLTALTSRRCMRVTARPKRRCSRSTRCGE